MAHHVEFKNNMTTQELLDKIKALPIPLDTGIIIADTDNNEYTIEDIEITMGGCFHPVFRLKKIEDPHDKWFRTRAIYIEELNNQIKLYESEEFKRGWAELHNGDLTKLYHIIDKQKSMIESIKEKYAPDEIVD